MTTVLGIWQPGSAMLTRARNASQDADRLTAALEGRETTVAPGYHISARPAPFDVSAHQLFADPHEGDAVTDARLGCSR